MSTGKAAALFLVGFLLALMAFPVAWAASAALGYLMTVAALSPGCTWWLREGRALPLALGIVLSVFAVLMLVGIAAVHLTFYTLSKTMGEVFKAVEKVRKETDTVTVINTSTATTSPTATTPKATRAGVVEASLGQIVAAGDWRVTVVEVVEAKYIKFGESYYGAAEGSKLVLVKLRIENAGREVKAPIVEFSTPVLATNANKSYEHVYPLSLRWIFQPTKEVVEGAVTYTGLDLWDKIAPGTYVEGYLMYQIPENEKAERLYLTYWPNLLADKTTISIKLVK